MSLQNKILNVDAVCDLVVVGSGAGGLSTAITATKRGLKVIVVEKEAVYGAGNEPRAVQRGNKSYDGTLTLLKSDVDLLGKAARAAGYASLIDVLVDEP